MYTLCMSHVHYPPIAMHVCTYFPTYHRWQFFPPSFNPGFVCGRIIKGRVTSCCSIVSTSGGAAPLLKGSTYEISWGAHPANLQVDIELWHQDSVWRLTMPVKLKVRLSEAHLTWTIPSGSKAQPTPMRGYRLQICPSELEGSAARSVSGACMQSQLFDIGQ